MIGLGHTNENGLTESRYLKAKFFRSTRRKKKKHRTKTKKENMPKNSEDRPTALGKKNSELSETKFQKKFQKKISKTDNEVVLPARESMKRPLTSFFPLP